jgi:hypothetical protein
MRPDDLKQEHSRFVQAVDTVVEAKCTAWRKDRIYGVGPRGRPKRDTGRATSVRNAIGQISLYAQRAALIVVAVPRLARTLPPPGLRGYTELPDIYSSFLDSLAGGNIDRCGFCRKPIGLTPKQFAARKRGRKVYCSDRCRIKAIESKPERKEKKALALRNLRERRKSGVLGRWRNHSASFA